MDTLKLVLLGGAATAALALARPSVAEVPTAPPSALADPQTQQAAPAAPAASAAASAPASVAIRSRGHDKVDQNVRPTTRLAQQNVPAPPAPPAPQAAPIQTPATVPYNPVTDDPASPGYIPAGHPGAGHPVPANLARLLNARKDPSAPWTLRWIPNPNGAAPAAAPAPAQPADPPVAALVALPPLPAAAPGQVQPRVVLGFNRDDGVPLTPQQRAELTRQLAAIGPKIEKALADAHIDDAVAKALKDAHIDETVDKAVKGIQPTVQKAIADARVRDIVAQRLAAVDAALVQAQEDAKRAAEQARRAAERAQHAQDDAAKSANSP